MTKYVTTFMQSLELLEAGIDRKTADYQYDDVDGVQVLHEKAEESLVVPAWSFGRLWDILHDSGQMFYEYPTTLSAVQVLDSLVEAVKRAVKTGRIK